MSTEEKIELIGNLLGNSDATMVADFGAAKPQKIIDRQEINRLAKKLKPMFSRCNRES